MNYFYLETPIQVICANEVVTNCEGDYHIIARFNRHPESDIQLANTLKYLNLEYAAFVLRPGVSIRSSAAMAFLLFKYLFFRNKDVFYVGDYFSKFGRVLRKTVFKNSECTYLDDGLSTLKAIDQLNRSNKRENFFTIFHRNLEGSVNSVQNSLSTLAENKRGETAPMGIIIGTHYVESGFTTLEDYLSLLSKIVEKYDCQFTYYAHREESDENTELYRKELGVDIERPVTPIEITLLKNGIYPRIFVSVLSSASFTLRHLYPKSDFYVVELPEVAHGSEENYSGIIDYARQIFGESNVLKVETA